MVECLCDALHASIDSPQNSYFPYISLKLLLPSLPKLFLSQTMPQDEPLPLSSLLQSLESLTKSISDFTSLISTHPDIGIVYQPPVLDSDVSSNLDNGLENGPTTIASRDGYVKQELTGLAKFGNACKKERKLVHEVRNSIAEACKCCKSISSSCSLFLPYASSQHPSHHHLPTHPQTPPPFSPSGLNS